MSEIWDAYDRNLRKLNNTLLERGKIIPNGFYHLVGEVIVKHKDGTYLLMQRDFDKHFGGMWELTACGSALCGENAFECAVRELNEETGIEAKALTEIDRIVSDLHQSIYVEFLYIADIVKNEITLRKNETIAYQWLTREEILKMQDEIASFRTLKMLIENIV